MTNPKQSSARNIVVVGVTSDVGSVAAARLKQAGHNVRGIARSLGTPISDQGALNHAFAGADAAYLMIPFDMHVADLHAFERQIGDHLVEAVSTSKVRRVILLSGLNAHLKMGTSLGAAEMEHRLNALDIPELVHLRAGFFNENFVKGMNFAAQAASGVFATPFRGDLPLPLIAASDIGERVAELLVTADWPRDRVVELHGGGYYTLAQSTQILADALGLTAVCTGGPYADARAGMVAGGISASFAEALIETATSFNNGERWALEAPGPRNTTQTSFQAWTARTIGTAFRAA